MGLGSSCTCPLRIMTVEPSNGQPVSKSGKSNKSGDPTRLNLSIEAPKVTRDGGILGKRPLPPWDLKPVASSKSKLSHLGSIQPISMMMISNGLSLKL